MREQFRRENPGMTFGQLAKYTSAMYKCLTPEEKEMWNQRAQQDKARFDTEMAAYVPPPGHDAQGNLIEDHRHNRKIKKIKDPAAPKRARGSFVFFTFDARPQIMQEYPGVKFVEMGTIMGERWRALSSEQKKKSTRTRLHRTRFVSIMKCKSTWRSRLPQAPVTSSMAAPMAATPHDLYMANMDHMQYDPNAYHHPHHGYDQTYQYHG